MRAESFALREAEDYGARADRRAPEQKRQEVQMLASSEQQIPTPRHACHARLPPSRECPFRTARPSSPCFCVILRDAESDHQRRYAEMTFIAVE